MYARRVQKKPSDLAVTFYSSAVFLSTGVACPQVQPAYLRVDPRLAVRHLPPLAPSRDGTIPSERTVAQMLPVAGPSEKMGR